MVEVKRDVELMGFCLDCVLRVKCVLKVKLCDGREIYVDSEA